MHTSEVAFLFAQLIVVSSIARLSPCSLPKHGLLANSTGISAKHGAPQKA